jgi:prepilin peptidase CpaA
LAPAATPFVLAAILAIALGISVVTDLRSRRIPDAVTLPATGLLLLARLLLTGWDGLFGMAVGVVGALAGWAVFRGIAWCGGMGLGDVKLMAAVGAALGWPLVLRALLFTAIAGGVQALVVAVGAGRLGPALRGAGALLLRGHGSTRRGTAPERGLAVPYAVAIAAGTAFAVLG